MFRVAEAVAETTQRAPLTNTEIIIICVAGAFFLLGLGIVYLKNKSKGKR